MQSCATYGDGFYNKGIHQAFGILQKEFLDMSITIIESHNSSNSYGKIMQAFADQNAAQPSEISISIMVIFFSTQELYLKTMIE